MINIKDLKPGQPTHPGEILGDELKSRKITQIEFAHKIGMQRSQLNEIIKGKRGINADVAILIEKVLGIPAMFWLDAQANYDLDKARLA